MNCVLHDAARATDSPYPAVAIIVCFGLSLCANCADAVVPWIAEGASVREILAAAVAGRLP